MLKLILPLPLLALVACGPLSRTTTERTRAEGGAETNDDATAPLQGSSQNEDTAAKVEAPKKADSSETETPWQTKSPHQSPTQSPAQSPPQSPHQSPSAAPPLTIAEVRYSGSACPDASVAANISPDRKAFTLLFDSFAVEIAPDSKGQTAQGGCELELDLVSAKGWQLTLLTIDERGYAALNAGDTARLATSFRFGPAQTPGVVTTTLKGAMDDNFQTRAEADLKTAPWSGCESTKTLRVRLDVALKAATALPAYLAVDSVDGELHHQAGLAFRRCE